VTEISTTPYPLPPWASAHSALALIRAAQPAPARLPAFVINLSDARDRWAAVEQTFAWRGFELVRVDAVDGTKDSISDAEYSSKSFRRRHGRTTNLREVGCYLSHVRACQAFLESGREHGLICEDDVTLAADFEEVIAGLLQVGNLWDIVRLSGLGSRGRVAALPLAGDYSLCVNFGRLKGAGVYLINRAATARLVANLLPMKVPYDHAVDREWVYGLRGVSVYPFPTSQTELGFRTSIQRGGARKLGSFRRWTATYPYQAVNEVSRWLFRSWTFLCLKLVPGRRLSAPRTAQTLA
jgi:glycosyl transferase family 25